MKKRLKIFSLFLICLLLISQISVYTSLTPSTIPHASEESEDQTNKNPKVSDVDGWYEWDERPGDSMGITTLSSSATSTVFSKGNGDNMYLVSNKTDTDTSVNFNGTSLLYIDDAGTTSYYEPTGLNMNLNHYTLMASDSNSAMGLSTTATENYAENYLESFDVRFTNTSTMDFASISYDRDRSNGYALNLTLGNPFLGKIIAFLDYDETLNEFKWYDETHSDPDYGDFFTAHYIINESGVWRDDTRIIDWSDQIREVWSYTEKYLGFIDIFTITIVKNRDTIVLHYYSDAMGVPLYELVFTRAVDNKLSLDFVLLMSPISLTWSQNIITIVMGSGVGSILFTFYIWDISIMLYMIMSAFWQIKFFWYWVYLDYWFFTLEIWFFGSIIHWIIDSVFYEWYYKIQIFLEASTFTDYIIHVHYLTYVYIYHVPTNVLPNKLLIDIINSIYTNTTFEITIMVISSEGLPINGADISGTWDGDTIDNANITNNNDGTYAINLTKILIFPNEPGKMLFINAHKNGYANGTLNVEIGVDPDTLEPNTSSAPSTKDNDDTGNKEVAYMFLPISFMISIISCISVVAIAKFIIKRRTIIKKRGGLA